MKIKRFLWLILFLQLAFYFLMPDIPSIQAQNAPENPQVILLNYDGPITPVLVEYVSRGIETAINRNASVVILQLNTPGGSIDLMNRVVTEIRNSTVPVVVYIAPRNAMAGSAGTIITLAGHVAAMAPETTIGAASPVGAQGEDIGEAMENKAKEMLKASARALASNRSEEAIRLAEDTIETAKAVTVDEALAIGLIDLKAEDISELLELLHGRVVIIGANELTIETRNAAIFEVPYSFIERVLKLMVDPNLVFLLLAVGVQAILIELSNPGVYIPGFIGVTSLLLAIYGLGILPVNWFGILFMILAFALFVLELNTPTFGALTVAGAISFIAGALILFNTIRMPGFPMVSVPLVIGTGVILGLSFLVIMTFAIKAQRSPIRTGRESVPGKTGIVTTDLDPMGQVQVAGELWSAELIGGDGFLGQGSRIEVIEVEGLRLKVRARD